MKIFKLVGQMFREDPADCSDLKKGDKISIVSEKNPKGYDGKISIKVMRGDDHLGYISNHDIGSNWDFFRSLKNGDAYVASISLREADHIGKFQHRPVGSIISMDIAIIGPSDYVLNDLKNSFPKQKS